MKDRLRKKTAKKYAVKFLEEVQADFPSLTVKKPPRIIFHKAQAYLEDGEGPIDGRTERTGGKIFVYSWKEQRQKDLHTTLRHEMVHAILIQNGRPAKDTDTLFMLMALKYNAAPYVVPPNLKSDIKTALEKKYSRKDTAKK